MPVGIYISVPFCRTKCSFCNFASDVFSKSAYENYVLRLLEDISGSRQFALELGCALDATADSIYLGGGTPSILDGAHLLRIFATMRDQFAVTPDAEITVECAPGTLTPALIATLLQCGVNRVSLGVQSFVDLEAQSVGRLHNRSIVLEEIGCLREAGLDNINLDLIAGLPHQTSGSWAYSVSEAIATGVPHVSVYMLEVDDESRLGRELIAGGARYHAHSVPDDDATADFYQSACDMLAAAGIEQYEISNFARVGAAPGINESRHNLKYWTRQPYLGFGVDAHSMLIGEPGERFDYPAIRFATADSLDAYLSRLQHRVTPVTGQAAIEEEFFLGLRLNRGIDLGRIAEARFWKGGDTRGSGTIESDEPEPSPGLKPRLSAEDLRDPQGQLFHGDTWHPGRRVGGSSRHRFSRSSSVGAEETVLGAEARCVSRPESAVAPAWESAIAQCIRDGLVEQHGTIVRLTARGRLLSNEVFARFLAEKDEETRVGTGNVNPR